MRRNRKFLRPIQYNYGHNIIKIEKENDIENCRNKSNIGNSTNSENEVNAGTRSSGRTIKYPNFLNIKDFTSKSYD